MKAVSSANIGKAPCVEFHQSEYEFNDGDTDDRNVINQTKAESFWIVFICFKLLTRDSNNLFFYNLSLKIV